MALAPASQENDSSCETCVSATLLAADDAVEHALEVAHSLVEQFLPELAKPLRERCGEICKLKALYDQLNTFQNNLLPLEETDQADEKRTTPLPSPKASRLSLSSRVASSESSPPPAVTPRSQNRVPWLLGNYCVL